MAHCERLPNGVVARVPRAMSARERDRLTAYTDSLLARVEERLAAETPEQKAARDL